VTLIPALFLNRETNLWKDVQYNKFIYSGFMPVSEAERRKKARFLENAPVPEFARSLPQMRQERLTVVDGSLRTHWIIWDGASRTEVAELLPEQYMLPLLTIKNPDYFITQALKVLASISSITASSVNSEEPRSEASYSAAFFIYFGKIQYAEVFARSFDSPYCANVLEIADDEWQVIVTLPDSQAPRDMLTIAGEIEEAAKRYHGNYDGWEVRIPDYVKRNNDNRN
jgi:hypothetical protein